jgi:hypothetical protein
MLPSIDSSDVEEMKTHFTVVLDRIEHLPGMMALTQLIKPSLTSCSHQQSSLLIPSSSDPLTPSEKPTKLPGDGLPAPPTLPSISLPLPGSSIPPNHNISVLRLVELSDRTSAVMKTMSIAAHPDQAAMLTQFDPLLSVYTTFAALNDLCVTPALETAPYEDLGSTVVDFVREQGQSAHLSGARTAGKMLLLPWLPPTVGHDTRAPTSPGSALMHNPFDTLFGKGSGTGGASTPIPNATGDRTSSSTAATFHAQFVRHVFLEINSRCRVIHGPRLQEKHDRCSGVVQASCFICVQRKSHPSALFRRTR